MIDERRSNRLNDDEDAESFIETDIDDAASTDNDLENLSIPESIKSIDIKRYGRRTCCFFLA